MVSGSASVISGMGAISGSPLFVDNSMTVNLTGVADGQLLTIRLSGVTDIMTQVLPKVDVTAGILERKVVAALLTGQFS